MNRRIAVVGDSLSSGGKIQPYSGPPFLVHGHQAALIGGSAFCTATLLGNQVMRRFFGTIGFGLAGVASVVTWTLIDSYLCSVFSSLCAPRVGECGGGVDACAITIQSTIKLLALLKSEWVMRYVG